MKLKRFLTLVQYIHRKGEFKISYYSIYSLILNILTVAIPLIVYFKKGNKMFNFVLLSLTIGISVELNIVDIISAIQIIMLIIFLILVLKLVTKKPTNNYYKNNKDIKKIILILIVSTCYTILVTNLFYGFTMQFILEGGLLRNELRPFFQSSQLLVFNFTIIAILLYFPIEKALIPIKMFVYTIFIVSLMGILQYLIYTATGFNIFPMRAERVFNFGLDPTFNNELRISAIMGEPKGLAKFVSLALAVLFLTNLNLKNLWLMKLVMIVCLILTKSATGFVMIAVIACFYIYKNMWKNIPKAIFSLGVVLFCLPFLFEGDVILSKVNPLDQYGNLEIVKEDNTISGIEDGDMTALLYFYENPYVTLTGVGIGNISYFAHEVVPSKFSYISNNMYSLRKDIIKIITETGFVGLIIKLLFWSLLYKRIKFSKFKHLFLCLVCLQLFFAISSLEHIYYYFYILIYMSTFDFNKFNSKVKGKIDYASSNT